MPSAQVKKAAKEHGTTVTKAEKKWKEAKKAAEESYGKEGQDIKGDKEARNSKFYGTVSKIFKNKMNAVDESKIMKFNEFKNNN